MDLEVLQFFWEAQHPTKFHSSQLSIATHEKLFFISSKQEMLVPLSKVFHTRWSILMIMEMSMSIRLIAWMQFRILRLFECHWLPPSASSRFVDPWTEMGHPRLLFPFDYNADQYECCRYIPSCKTSWYYQGLQQFRAECSAVCRGSCFSVDWEVEWFGY